MGGGGMGCVKGGERGSQERTFRECPEVRKSKQEQDADSENREKTESRNVSVSTCLSQGASDGNQQSTNQGIFLEDVL